MVVAVVVPVEVAVVVAVVVVVGVDVGLVVAVEVADVVPVVVGVQLMVLSKILAIKASWLAAPKGKMLCDVVANVSNTFASGHVPVCNVQISASL